MMFQRRDRVKLTEKAATTALRGYSGLLRRIPIDWPNRRGTVQNTPYAASACVVIKWDDKKWGDSWPKAAIEKDK